MSKSGRNTSGPCKYLRQDELIECSPEEIEVRLTVQSLIRAVLEERRKGVGPAHHVGRVFAHRWRHDRPVNSSASRSLSAMILSIKQKPGPTVEDTVNSPSFRPGLEMMANGHPLSGNAYLPAPCALSKVTRSLFAQNSKASLCPMQIMIRFAIVFTLL